MNKKTKQNPKGAGLTQGPDGIAKQVQFRLYKHDVELLNEEAKNTGLNKSEVVRELIRINLHTNI